MSNWKEYKLDELVEITSSKRIMRSEYQENGIPFFRSKEIIELNSGNEITTELFISKERFLEIKNKFGTPSYGDILLTSVGTLGVPYFVNYKEEFYFKDGNLTWFRKFNNILRSKYLYYWFSSPVGRKALKEITIGSTQPALTITGLKSLTIHLPTLEEQDYIIEILDHLSSKIHLNTQINQTLEQIAQALFKSWFVDFDPVRAKVQALSDGLSFEQAELAVMQAISGKTPKELTALSQTQPERYAELAETAKAFPCEMVEVDGGEVPKGWEVKRIDEVIQKIPVGKKYSSKTAFSEGLVPILDQGRSGVIGYHNDKPGVKASIEDPIIVFANHTCYMRLISYDFSAIQNVFAFKGKECNLYWLYLATLGKQEFVEYKGHFPDFLIKEIIVPPEELTELFGKYVKESFSKIFIKDRENSSLAKIRDLLLPKLLNGEI
ncbi:restriction endonuclease subunit S [Aggregatibacter sp. HMT-949]|uniref:restriction endonuclease subunit S n=1 Tax=Aggregatibacter sp. HMT-949 TaxID=3235088 RepID=UPI00359C5CB5